MKEEPDRFKEYAMRDAIITLVHAMYMEDFNFKLGNMNIPVTLSSLSASFLTNK
jgi:hypothetical protein